MNVGVIDVLSWSRVQLPVSACRRSARIVEPMGVTITSGPADRSSRGQVVCGYQSQGSLVGLAWDWMEVRRNVVVMSDPMCIVSNLDLVDDADGSNVAEGDRLLVLNELAFALDWQREVCNAVRAHA
jgi:hypothetical protein